LEKPISARGFMETVEKLRYHIDKLSTSSIALILPDFADDFGESKNIDIKVYVSKNKFLEGFPATKPTSVVFERNGNLKA
jgi:hypothetical protein